MEVIDIFPENLTKPVNKCKSLNFKQFISFLLQLKMAIFVKGIRSHNLV
jgi:hypothetical protein